MKKKTRSGGHSPEELRLIVSSSRGSGYLPETQEDMIHRILDLDELSVREIMVPRNQIVAIASSATLDEVLRTMREQQHSRLPVYKDKPEQIVGILYFKDMLHLWQDRRAALRLGRVPPAFDMNRLARKFLIVPETKPLVQMLEEFRQGKSHMAVVVDEFGTISGLLTVEDVLEQIVGEIEDEFDDPPVITPPEGTDMLIDGTTKIRDFENLFEVELPADAGFETVAGFSLYKLGHIPMERAKRWSTTDAVSQSRTWTEIELRRSKSKESRRSLHNQVMLGIDPRAAKYTFTAAIVLALLYGVFVIRGMLFVVTISIMLAYLLYPLVDLLGPLSPRNLPGHRRWPLFICS